MARRFTPSGSSLDDAPAPSNSLAYVFGLLGGAVEWIDPDGTNGRRFHGGIVRRQRGGEEWRLDDGTVVSQPAASADTTDSARIEQPKGLTVLVTTGGRRFTRPIARAGVPWAALAAWASRTGIPTSVTRVWLEGGLVAWISRREDVLRIDVRDHTDAPSDSVRLIFAPAPVAAFVAAVRAAGLAWMVGLVVLMAAVGLDAPGRLALGLLLWSIVCVLSAAAFVGRLRAAERPRLELDVDGGRWVGPWRRDAFEWREIVGLEWRASVGVLILRRERGRPVRIALGSLSRGDDAARLIQTLARSSLESRRTS